MSELLSDSFQKVIKLQNQIERFAGQQTEKLGTRRQLIEVNIPSLLRSPPFFDAISDALSIETNDLLIEGSSGTPIAAVPWVRFADRKLSPTARKGRYCVFLFDVEGEAVYLSLNQASTSPDWKTSVVALPESELRSGASWARSQLESLVENRSDLLEEINLRWARKSPGSKTAGPYEQSNAFALEYKFAEIPEDSKILEDLKFFSSLLRELNEKILIGADPLEDPQEILQAEEASEQELVLEKRRKSGGQSFRQNQAQRKAIELRGMEVARDFLLSEGWVKVKDTSSNKPYDFLCEQGEKKLFVEVKATTSSTRKVVVTRGEVEHNKEHENHALIFVSNILLTGEKKEVAEGGEVEFINPWEISDEDLTVISYKYSW